MKEKNIKDFLESFIFLEFTFHILKIWLWLIYRSSFVPSIHTLLK